MSRLTDLYATEDQSPWLDNVRRDWIENGEMQRWVDRGVRGVTSNPTIFQKAISGGDAYDDQFRQLLASGTSVTDAYWELVVTDINNVLSILRPVYDSSKGIDGYVSIEVSPLLARDTVGTASAARHLHGLINQPNLYIKIPGTAEGLPAIKAMISEGVSVNVTLLFSLERYREVMESYISGLEARDGDLSDVSSVASFFISRVDSETDKRLEAHGSEEAKAPWPTRRLPTRHSSRPSVAPGGKRLRPVALVLSVRFGHPRRPKTRTTQTRCMSIPSLAPTQSTRFPRRPSMISTITALWPEPSMLTLQELTRSSMDLQLWAFRSQMSPHNSKTKAWPRSRSHSMTFSSHLPRRRRL